MTTPAPVFISYCQNTAKEAASALASALPAGDVFQDLARLGPGSESISGQLMEALLGARVVVCFLDEEYFQRPYCFAEWQFALKRWRQFAASSPGSRGVLLVLPSGNLDRLLRHLPADMQDHFWPLHQDLAAQRRLLEDQLALEHVVPLGSQLSPGERADLCVRGAAYASISTRSSTLNAIPSFQLPDRPEGQFLGREKLLRELLQRLTDQIEPVACCLAGGGGTGKSRVALEFVWRYGEDYFPDGIFWLDAGTPNSWGYQLHGLLLMLDGSIPTPADGLSEDFNVFQRLSLSLEREPHRRRLLVLDNLPPGTDFRGEQGLLPTALGGSAILLTSRAAAVPPAVSFPVMPLPRWASCALLMDEVACGEPISAELADRLSARLGDWPLALQLLQLAFSTGTLDLSQLKELSESAAVLPLLDDTERSLREVLPAGSVRGVTETLALSFENLKPDSQALAKILCWCADAPIPSILLSILQEQGVTRSARAALPTRSWIIASTSDSYGRMHPVLADYLRLLEDSANAIAPLAAGIRTLQRKHDSSILLNRDVHSLLAPHALAASRNPQLSLVTRLELLGEVAYLLGVQHQKQECLTLREEAWRLSKQDDPLSPLLAFTYEYQLLNSQFSLAPEQLSLECLHDASERALRALGDQHELTLRVQWLEAKWLSEQELDLVSARQLFTDILERHQTFGNSPLTQVASTLRELSLIDLKLNALESSAQFMREAYNIALVTCGSDHQLTIDCAHHLAMVLTFLGQFSEALPISTTVLALRSERLGSQHPDTILTAHNHSELLYLMGRWQESAAGFEDVAAARARHYGERDARTLNSLAHLWRVRGALNDPKALLELGALKERMAAARGRTHSWTRKVCGFIAQIAIAQGDAMPSDCQPLAILQAERDGDPPLLGQLAHALLSLGWQALQTAESGVFQSMYQANRDELIRILTMRHPQVLLLEAQQDVLAGARPEVLESLTAVLGTDHPDVKRLLQYLVVRPPSGPAVSPN